MAECVASGHVDAAVELFRRILEEGMGPSFEPETIPIETRSRFFAFVSGQLDDEYLRRNGLPVLAMVRAHGVKPPHVLQNRLICAWGNRPPEQLLRYFLKMREEGVALCSSACRCIMAEMVDFEGETARSTLVGTSRGQRIDAPVSELDPAHKAEEDAPEATPPSAQASAEWTSMRSQAPSFVPMTSGDFWDMSPAQIEACEDWAATVILRNLPCPFLREDLIRVMDRMGFAGVYNLVYMPIDFVTELSMGYAFVNLHTNEDAQRLMLAFHGFRDWPRSCWPTSKTCAADLSRTQGLARNVNRYRNSPVMAEGVPERFRPVLFNGSQRVSFPGPTRELPPVLHIPGGQLTQLQ
jgi:hypothetical protein